MAATKSELVDDPTKAAENLLTFPTPPNLGAFRFILSIITEELLEYKIWPVRVGDPRNAIARFLTLTFSRQIAGSYVPSFKSSWQKPAVVYSH